MADIATFWDVAASRGDWAFTSTPPGGFTLLSTDPDADTVVTTESGIEIELEGLAAPALADLVSGHDLETAVLISLFTDRTADPADVIPDGTADPRGWWGDDGEAYPIGSRLWLLARAKATQATLNLAKDAIVEALQWLIDDGVAAAIAVVTEYTRPGLLGAAITISEPSGAASNFQYSWVWSAL